MLRFFIFVLTSLCIGLCSAKNKGDDLDKNTDDIVLVSDYEELKQSKKYIIYMDDGYSISFTIIDQKKGTNFSGLQKKTLTFNLDLMKKNKIIKSYHNHLWICMDCSNSIKLSITKTGGKPLGFALYDISQHKNYPNVSFRYTFNIKDDDIFLNRIEEVFYRQYLGRFISMKYNINTSLKSISNRIPQLFYNDNFIKPKCEIKYPDSNNRMIDLEEFDWIFDIVKKVERNNENNILQYCVVDHFVSEDIFNYKPVSKKVIQALNDLGYYLWKHKEYKAAIDMLSSVIDEAPTRAVAHLNLADAYWDSGKKTEAKASYKTYQKLMQTQGKDLSKIPKYVAERLNSKD